MKITATKVKEELLIKGWVYVDPFLVRDIIDIIDTKLKYHKGISIKK